MVGESPTMQRKAEKYIGAVGYPTTTPWRASDAVRRSMPRWLIVTKDDQDQQGIEIVLAAKFAT
jgi:hypothetical protein